MFSSGRCSSADLSREDAAVKINTGREKEICCCLSEELKEKRKKSSSSESKVSKCQRLPLEFRKTRSVLCLDEARPVTYTHTQKEEVVVKTEMLLIDRYFPEIFPPLLESEAKSQTGN